VAGNEHARNLLRRAHNLDLPFSAFQAITGLRSELERLEWAAIQSARQKGATWDEIASALGVSRQALHQRLRRARPGDLRRRAPAAG
jgi:DNA-directed RNA polymerase specialized sigma24 family protein